jgi:hypothetical protein
LLVKQTRRAKKPILLLGLTRPCQIGAEQTRRASIKLSTLLDSVNAPLVFSCEKELIYDTERQIISCLFLAFGRTTTALKAFKAHLSSTRY